MNFAMLPGAAKIGLLNAIYQLGVGGLLGFVHMWGYIRQGHYALAAREALNSKWAQQTPNRAARLARLLQSCEPPPSVPAVADRIPRMRAPKCGV